MTCTWAWAHRSTCPRSSDVVVVVVAAVAVVVVQHLRSLTWVLRMWVTIGNSMVVVNLVVDGEKRRRSDKQRRWLKGREGVAVPCLR